MEGGAAGAASSPRTPSEESVLESEHGEHTPQRAVNKGGPWAKKKRVFDVENLWVRRIRFLNRRVLRCQRHCRNLGPECPEGDEESQEKWKERKEKWKKRFDKRSHQLRVAVRMYTMAKGCRKHAMASGPDPPMSPWTLDSPDPPSSPAPAAAAA